MNIALGGQQRPPLERVRPTYTSNAAPALLACARAQEAGRTGRHLAMVPAAAAVIGRIANCDDNALRRRQFCVRHNRLARHRIMTRSDTFARSSVVPVAPSPGPVQC